MSIVLSKRFVNMKKEVLFQVEFDSALASNTQLFLASGIRVESIWSWIDNNAIWLGYQRSVRNQSLRLVYTTRNHPAPVR